MPWGIGLMVWDDCPVSWFLFHHLFWQQTFTLSDEKVAYVSE
jgi:hypothetical protein